MFSNVQMRLDIDGDIVKRLIHSALFHYLRERKPSRCALRPRNSVEKDEAVRLGERERPEQRRVYEAEHHGRRSDSHSESDEDGGRVARAVLQRASRERQLFQHSMLMGTARATAKCRHSPKECETGVRLRTRSEEHTSELQSPCNLVCRLLL